MNQLRFISLGSGSSGNSYYLGNKTYGILIDAGIGIRNIRKRLKEQNLALENILAVFITHEHYDHIKSVDILSDRYHLPIYATKKILDGINNNKKLASKIPAHKNNISINTPIQIKDFNIIAFPISHDASETLGYSIVHQDKRFTLLTDLGYICETAAEYIKLSNHLVIEANYDTEMLNKSAYPPYLRERIDGKKGHLSNQETALFLSENYSPLLENIFLCHLSKNNNTAELAYHTVKDALESKNILINKNLKLEVLPRTQPSECFILQ